MTPQRTVWVTGAGGLIGSHLVNTAAGSRSDTRVIPLTRADVDLTDFGRVEDLFRRQRPEVIIHCAAMSRSPDCQKEPGEARLQNVEVTRHLCQLAQDSSFVLLSTDLVFDGRKGNYTETDPVNPLSVYAETKLAAEEIVLQNPAGLVIRTSLNAGRSPTGDRGMDEQLIRAWKSGTKMTLFDDEFRCPIPAAATARAIWDLLDIRASGLFHVAGAERLSRWEIGSLLVARYPDYRPMIGRGSLRSYEGAPRSPDTSLNCGRAQARLRFALPKFSEWIQHV